LKQPNRPQSLCFYPVGRPIVLLSMELDPKVIGFILYCTRQEKQWPDLYDEMCRVAGQGLYQGLHYRDLRKMGLSFSLSGLGTTIQMIESVTESRIENGPFSHQMS
jgi:hypothetical protein